MRPGQQGGSLLNLGAKPTAARGSVNPDAPWVAQRVSRAVVKKGDQGALPPEAFQYDVILELFRADTAFWEEWSVVDCVRTRPGESVNPDKACIRVVMDIPSERRPFPTIYSPEGAGTVGDTLQGMLQPGHSVLLEVVRLEEARLILSSQRALRGQVEEKYRWLERIVGRADGVDENDRRPEPRGKQRARQGARGGRAAGALGALEASSQLPLSDAVPSFSDEHDPLHGVALGAPRQVVDECRVVDEFEGRLALSGGWVAEGDARFAPRGGDGAASVSEDTEDDELEKELKALQERARTGRQG